MDILAFCRNRDIAAEGIKISQDVAWSKKHHDQSKIILKIELPPHFPPKYDSTIGKAADRCLVASLGRALDKSSFEHQVTRTQQS